MAATITERDIQNSARMLIKTLGLDEARDRAQTTVVALAAVNDMAGRDLWLAVVKAIDRMRYDGTAPLRRLALTVG